jgi:uncharacterized membrane protein (GlpM family)
MSVKDLLFQIIGYFLFKAVIWVRVKSMVFNATFINIQLYIVAASIIGGCHMQSSYLLS